MAETRREPEEMPRDDETRHRRPAAGSSSEGIWCPVCGALCEQIRCKVVCSRCRTLVYNCSEF